MHIFNLCNRSTLSTVVSSSASDPFSLTPCRWSIFSHPTWSTFSRPYGSTPLHPLQRAPFCALLYLLTHSNYRSLFFPIGIACWRAPPALFIQSKHSRARHPLLAQPLDPLLPRYLHAGGKLGKTPGRWRSGSNTGTAGGGWGAALSSAAYFLWLNRFSQGVSRWDKLCARDLLETKFMTK